MNNPLETSDIYEIVKRKKIKYENEDYLCLELKDTSEFELGSEVDYIQVPSPINAWCPVQSNIQVTLQPIYSRSAVEQFSLASFVGGAFNGKGADGGFI